MPASEAWRSNVPAPATEAKRSPPVFQVETLENGLTLLFLRVEGLPIASLRLATIGGSATDPPGQAGLSFLTYGALRDGAGTLDGAAFERTVQKLGAEIAMDVDRDYGSIEIAGISEVVPGMIRMLAEAVIRPRLDPKALAARKERHLKKLVARSGAPLAVAADRAPALLFGDHPYGHASYGAIEAMARIDVAAIKKHHAALFRPERSALIVVGELELDAVRPLVARWFGEWKPTGAAVSLALPEPRASARSDVLLIHRDNVSQAFVCAGRAIPGANAEQEVALAVLNQILGGAFNSRLQLLLRETKGWTYAANSAVTSYRGAGELLACTQVERSATAEAVRTLVGEIGRMATEPPSDAEIRSAVLGLQASVYGRETVSQLSLLGAESFARDRGPDWLARYESGLASIGPDAVRNAASLLATDRLQIVVVANARGLREELEKLGLGTVALSR